MFSWQCWSTSSEPALASFKVTCSRLSCGKVLMLVAHSQRCKETVAALNPGLCFRKPHVFKISSKSLHVKATASTSSWSILSRTRPRPPPRSSMVRMLSFILPGVGRLRSCGCPGPYRGSGNASWRGRGRSYQHRDLATLADPLYRRDAEPRTRTRANLHRQRTARSRGDCQRTRRPGQAGARPRTALGGTGAPGRT